MDLKSIAALALAEDAAADIGAAGFNPPTNPDFESKHPRGNSANKGQFRKSEKTLAKLADADAALSPDGRAALDPAAEYAAVEAKYKGTPEWMKAPNGEPTNLSERQWVQVRTPSFKAWFGDWEAIAEEKSMSDRLNAWVSDEGSIEWAKGKSLSECEERLGSEKEPIAYLPSGYLSHFSGNAKDNRIYTSRGYLIDHIANHKHDDVGASEYRLLQQMFLSPDEVIKDTRPKPNGVPRDSLLFVKRFSKNRLAAVELSEQDGHIVLHKSLYNTKDRVYPSLPRVVLSGGGRSPISHAASATPGGSLSARDANIVSNFFEPVNPAAVSKVIDANGEPMVVYHGSRWDPLAEPEGKAIFNTKSPPKHHDLPMQLDFGTHFTIDKKTARGYGRNVTEAFLNIRNPKKVPDGFLSKDTYDGIVREGFDGVDYTPTSHWVDATGDNPVNNVYKYPRSFIVMEPSQIKSATANSGSFSPAKESILDSAPAFNPAAFLNYLAGKKKE